MALSLWAPLEDRAPRLLEEAVESVELGKQVPAVVPLRRSALVLVLAALVGRQALGALLGKLVVVPLFDTLAPVVPSDKQVPVALAAVVDSVAWLGTQAPVVVLGTLALAPAAQAPAALAGTLAWAPSLAEH